MGEAEDRKPKRMRGDNFLEADSIFLAEKYVENYEILAKATATCLTALQTADLLTFTVSPSTRVRLVLDGAKTAPSFATFKSKSTSFVKSRPILTFSSSFDSPK